MRARSSLAWLMALSAGHHGCAALRLADNVRGPARPPRPVDEGEFHCARAAMDKNSPYRMPLAGPVDDPALAAHLAAVPYKARRAALAAGLEPLLSRLLAARSASDDGGQTPLALALEEELTLRLVAFHAQVSATAFEAGCTADMIQKLLPELARREQSRQFSIAVVSLVVGAVTGIAAGTWSLSSDDPRGPAITGIVGGVVTTALGAAALHHEEHATPFLHGRNRLVPLANGVDPDHFYPSFVFRMLTYPDEADHRTPREELLSAWQAQLDRAVPPSKRAAARQLLLGDGGQYDDDVLALRAEMFESLESAVQGMARDLELLNRSLVRSLTVAVPAPAPMAAPVATPMSRPAPTPAPPPPPPPAGASPERRASRAQQRLRSDTEP